MFPWRFEQEQALVQEQLARLAQREKERDSAAALAAVGGACHGHVTGDVTSTMIMEQSRTHEELEKNKILVSPSNSHTGTRCCDARLH